MAEINFLPSEDNQLKKEAKKIRKIEYTNPELEKKSKPTQHGGILSIFGRKQATQAFTPPPPPPKQNKETEPIVTAHGEAKKFETKRVITYQKPDMDTRKKGNDKPKKEGFFSRLFSKKQRAVLPPPPPLEAKKASAPSFVPQPALPEKPVGNGSRMDQKMQFHHQKQEETSGRSGAPMPPQKPFSPFNRPIPRPEAQKASESKPTIVPPMATPHPFEKAKEQSETSMPIPDQHTPLPVRPGLMFDVNLVPDELAQKKRSLSKLTWLALIVVISITVVGASYFGIAFYKESVAKEADRLDSDIERIKQQIKVLEPIQLDALVLQKRTEEISDLLDSHVYWTRFFEKLEQYTLTQVSFASVIANEDGTVTIAAESIKPDYAYQQLRVFEQAEDFISQVTMTTPTIPTTTTTSANENSVLPSELQGLIPGTTSDVPGSTQPTSSFTFQIKLSPTLLYSSPTL